MSNFSSESKQFILSNRFGMLSTQSNEQYPFGSIVPYVVSKNDSRLIIQVAQIAEHYKNLKESPKSTLLVSDPFGTHEPMKYPRATIFTSWVEAVDIERESIRQQFVETVGTNIPPEIEPSFSYFSGEIQKVRWIGGFAKVGWVTKDEYIKATYDPISKFNYEIVTHMNQDHADAVHQIAVHFSNAKKAMGSRMIQVLNNSIIIRTADGADLNCPLGCECTTADDIRGAIIKLLKSIRHESVVT